MLFKKALKYCRDTGILSLIESSPCIIAGFSGGADSAVLLSFFISLKKTVPGLKIVAAHVNHMIRGDEANRDACFAESFCKDRGIPFELLSADVPGIAREQGKGIEEAAREVRYSFFDSLCKKYNTTLIATAHNCDDNMETVLLNLMRGSGTKGISGIAPILNESRIRPLLSCTSEEIRTFAKDAGIPYVTDSTNFNTDYTRNAIRHKIVPLMKESNGKVTDAVQRLSLAAREDCDFIEKEAASFLSNASVTRKALADLHPALFQRVLFELYKREAKTASNLSEKNVSDCRRLVCSTGFGSVSLPRGLAFFADRNEVYINTDPRFNTNDVSDTQAKLPLFYDIPVFEGDFCIIASKKQDNVNIFDENIYNLSLHTSINCDKISSKLFVRRRSPGDTFRFHGMNRKLKKLLCDKNIPVQLRNNLPLIEDSEGILLVPFIGVRDGCARDQMTDGADILEIYVYRRSAK